MTAPGLRRGALTLALILVFLTLGAPRWLDRAPAPPGAQDETRFADVCRTYGGTPTADACTVRYGGRIYRMDAVTPAGFDEDAARFNRMGCAHADGNQGTFVFHADTGVCENRVA
jgi:hypothetical protein